MKTVAIIQARMSSSRLPGKVLLDLGGEPMLVRVVERTRRATCLDEVVVASTTDPSDDRLADFCAQRGYSCSRGSQYDVLERYVQAARQAQADVIVRITADCPLIDPQVIDQTVQAFLSTSQPDVHTGKPLPPPPAVAFGAAQAFSASKGFPFDFAANRLPPPYGRTFPIGLDTEVCTSVALELAWRQAGEKHQREHVMPYFYEHPEIFRMLLWHHTADYGAMRWTVDTPEDLELLRQIYMRYPDDTFSWLQVLELFQQHPELAEINADVPHKHYRQIDERA